MGDLLGLGRLVGRVVGRSHRVEIGGAGRSMIVHELTGHVVGRDSVGLSCPLATGTLKVGAIQPTVEARAIPAVVLGDFQLPALFGASRRAVLVASEIRTADLEVLRTPHTTKLKQRLLLHGTPEYWTACPEP